MCCLAKQTTDAAVDNVDEIIFLHTLSLLGQKKAIHIYDQMVYKAWALYSCGSRAFQSGPPLLRITICSGAPLNSEVMARSDFKKEVTSL